MLFVDNENTKLFSMKIDHNAINDLNVIFLFCMNCQY